MNEGGAAVSAPAVSEVSPAPLPLAELLAVLRSRGLPIGIREHLTVGRLLARWDDPDTASLRAALAAILARNPQEVALVRETFDQLYLPPAAPQPGLSSSPPPPERRERRWIAWLAAALVAFAAVAFTISLVRSHLHPPKPPVVPAGAAPSATPLTPPPAIVDTHKVVNPGRRWAGAGAAAALVFLWLYGVRTHRQAGRRGRRRLSAELDARPGPQGYDLVLRDLAPPFRADLLDDVAAILGRRASDAPGGHEMDVDRTLKRTLDAGLAPSIVFRARASTLPLLVLEDVGDEMRPYRRQIAALLAGLEARGVHLDRWRFDADADRLFCSADGAALALRQLRRRRAESPLLVISTGQGILEGDERRVAAWVPALRYWKRRTWLHPVADPRAWRSSLSQAPLDVWPMTRPGLLAAARQIARGDTRLLGLREARALPERAVTPLDVDRLRWLLSLAPRRDPELAELLRQRFCPEVPAAALPEALAAPTLTVRPPLGLDDAAVHAFFLRVLDDSRPEPGSAGYERWRLDRALQALGAHRPAEAETELAALADSPLAPEVERALRRTRTLPAETAQRLQAQVLRPLARRARKAGLAVPDEREAGWRWTWPTLGEATAALVGAAALWLALPLFGVLARDTVPLKLRTAYRLTLRDPDRRGSFALWIQRIGRGPAQVDLYRETRLSQRFNLDSRGEAVFSGFEPERGHWFYARARSGSDDLVISNSVWVEPAQPVPAPVPPPAPPVSVPSKQQPKAAPPRAARGGSPPILGTAKKKKAPNFKPESLGLLGTEPAQLTPNTPSNAAAQIPPLVNPAQAPPEQKQEPAPQPQQPAYEPPGSLVQRTGGAIHVHLDCGKETTQELIYALQADETYVGSSVQLDKSSNMGLTMRGKPVYNPATRRVSATIPLRGPRSHCETGGDLDFHLRVTVRIAPKSKA